MTIVKVYAKKADRGYGMDKDVLYLGDVDAVDFPDAFIKALRLYNKNVNRGVNYPFFLWKDKRYVCSDYEVPTVRGIRWYWGVKEFVKNWGADKHYILNIPKTKVKDKSARKYLE